MSLIKYFDSEAGVSENNDGTYRIDLNDGTSRLAMDAELIAAKRAQIREQINAERNRREQTSFPFAGKQINSDPDSVQRITVAFNNARMALEAGVEYNLNWTCADDSELPLDAMGVCGMVQALGLYGVHLHYYGRALKAAVNASDTPETIDILTGWPE